MTYVDGLHAGLWALGAITPFALLALVAVALVLVDIPHRIRVLKLRRDVRRSGRTTYDPTTGSTSDGLNLGPRRSACTCPDPSMAARSGHLRACPLNATARSA